jgi:hypothetical protein
MIGSADGLCRRSCYRLSATRCLFCFDNIIFRPSFHAAKYSIGFLLLMPPLKADWSRSGKLFVTYPPGSVTKLLRWNLESDINMLLQCRKIFASCCQWKLSLPVRATIEHLVFCECGFVVCWYCQSQWFALQVVVLASHMERVACRFRSGAASCMPQIPARKWIWHAQACLSL